MTTLTSGARRYGRGGARLVSIATAIVLAGGLASCNSGGGGNRIFFGSNGHGDCRALQVNIDLRAAGASAGGQPEQARNLDDALAASGCDILITESNGVLHVAILGCTIPAAANLFDCVLSGADPLDIQRVSEGLCGCDVQRHCDPFPPLCVGGIADHDGCEICSNGLDDDGNGVADCNDDNCRHVDPCATTTTTSTSTTTTSTSTSSTLAPPTTSSTTTTMPVLTSKADVELSVESASGLIAALQIQIDYSDIPGEFDGEGAEAACKDHLPSALVTFNDNSTARTLTMGVVSLDGLRAPIHLATCKFSYASITPVSNQFAIEVQDATDPDFNPIDVNVEPEIIPIPPTTIPTTSTTSTSSTSTTLQPPDPFLYTIVFELASSSEPLGALQLETGYGSGPGAFVGTGGDVDCRSRVGSTRAFNHNAVSKTLDLGFVSLQGISAPLDLVRCRYRSETGAPTANQFQTTIVDISDTGFGDAQASITVRVEEQP